MLGIRHIGALSFLAAATAAGARDAQFLWESRVRPVLDAQCVKCHGPLEEKSGLLLDTLDAILRGGDEGAVVVPGKPAESRLFTYLAAESDPHMPPKKQLPEADVAAIGEWITALTATPAAPASTAAAAPVPTEPVAAIDHFLSLGWQARGVTTAPLCDDRTFCRRAYLDLVGHIPTAEELERFLFSAAPDKRAALVDELLAQPAYARHMRDTWDALLMGRGGNQREDRRAKNGWFAFLERAFGENRPWTETVRAVITARPDDSTRGAQWFLYERKNQHQAVAEAVAPVIYGTKIDCAQCHDHPLAREIKQAHYWGLVAAFNRSQNVDTPQGPAVGESAIGGFVNFTNLRKESQPAVVTMLTGRTIDENRPPDGQKEEDAPDKYADAAAPAKVPKFSRRAALAEAATTDNPLLARAFVNREWARLTGRGLVHPVDEINSRNAASHPELFDWLAADFAAHGHDVKRLVRAIVLSRAYQATPGPESPPPEAFARQLERPLTAEQLARSWRVASGLPAEDDAFRRAVVESFPDVQPRVYNATFQQAQFLENSPALATLLSTEANPTLQRLTALPSAAERVRGLFLAVYNRLPQPDEAERITEALSRPGTDERSALRDAMWALMISPEALMAP